jgi:alpha-amylase
MKNICLIFQIHHPFHLQTFRYFDIGSSKTYYDEYRIEQDIVDAISNCYRPGNMFLKNLIEGSDRKLMFSFHISGTALDQFLMYDPEIIEEFKLLGDAGCAEFTGGTSSHSIAGLASNLSEFRQQISLHKERTQFYFGQSPVTFINTNLLFTKRMAEIAFDAGYKIALTNGAKKILQWRSPNYLYSSIGKVNMSLLFRNDRLSNDFKTLFTVQNSLMEKQKVKAFISTLEQINSSEPIINICVNYSDIFGGPNMSFKQRLFQKFVEEITISNNFSFWLPSELIEEFGSVAELESADPVCWVEDFHPSYFPGNDLQKDAIHQLFKLEKLVRKIDNQDLLMDWKYLQTSNHFHLMDENHPSFSGLNRKNDIFKSKYDTYINFMNILEDFHQRLKAEVKKVKTSKKLEKSTKPNSILKSDI